MLKRSANLWNTMSGRLLCNYPYRSVIQATIQYKYVKSYFLFLLTMQLPLCNFMGKKIEEIQRFSCVWKRYSVLSHFSGLWQLCWRWGSFLYERLKWGKLSLSLTAVRGFLITHAIPLVVNTTKLLCTELKRTAAFCSTAELWKIGNYAWAVLSLFQY